MKRGTWPISSFSPVSAPSDSLKWATCTVHSKCWFLPYPQNGGWGVCRVAGCSAPHQALVLWSMPPSGPCQPPPPTLIWVSNIQPHVCTHVNTHCAHFLAPSACRPGTGRCWLTGPVMYRLHLNSAHLESHKAKVITILLQRTLHRRGGQRRSAKCVPDKKYICSCFEFHIKKHAKKREGELGGELRVWSDILMRAEKSVFQKGRTRTHIFLYFIYILICMYTYTHTKTDSDNLSNYHPILLQDLCTILYIILTFNKLTNKCRGVFYSYKIISNNHLFSYWDWVCTKTNPPISLLHRLKWADSSK